MFLSSSFFPLLSCSLIVLSLVIREVLANLFSTFVCQVQIGMFIVTCIFIGIHFIWGVAQGNNTRYVCAFCQHHVAAVCFQAFTDFVENWSVQWQLRNFSHPVTPGVSSHPLVPNPAALRHHDWCCTCVHTNQWKSLWRHCITAGAETIAMWTALCLVFDRRHLTGNIQRLCCRTIWSQRLEN